MTKDFAKEFMQKLDFPLNAQNQLLATLDRLLKSNEFLKIVSCYNDINFDFSQMLSDVKSLSNRLDVCEYTAYTLLFICMAPTLRERYKQKGIDDKIFYDTMQDLKYKLDECSLVHGKIGTFVPNWYKGFFEMKIFALGRLQFEINHTWFDCEVKGIHIPKGSKALSVHIPRTNTRLDHKLALDAYHKAKKFFKDEFQQDIIFICNSWLLYPWNRTIYNDGSNLAQFYDDFTIVQSGEYANYNECWRLFDCLYDGNPDNLPNNTSLRRAFIKRIKSGEPIGHGTGVILFNK